MVILNPDTESVTDSGGLNTRVEAENEQEATTNDSTIHQITTLNNPPQQTAMGDLDKAFMLCICQSASIGGTGTLIGTATNMALVGIVDTLYGPDTGLDFATWLSFAVPSMILSLLCSWLWLQIVFLGINPRSVLRALTCKADQERVDREAAVKTIIRDQYKALGPISFAECAILGHFVILASLWLTRDPRFIPGWASIFHPYSSYIKDSTVAILVGFSLFVFPSERPTSETSNGNVRGNPSTALLNWHLVQHNLAWDMLLLLGGGFSLAVGVRESGLSDLIAEKFVILEALPPIAIVLIVTTTITFITEFTSNVSTATIFLPILAKIAESIKMNPFKLMLPATLACSYAFMLPVATPPNAIVFSASSLRIIDMVKSGFMMNLICVCTTVIATLTMGAAIFDLNNYPTWAVIT